MKHILLAFHIILTDRRQEWNLADSRYVWLPMGFDASGKPVIEWRKECRPGI